MKLILHIGTAPCDGEVLADWADANADGLRSEGVWAAQGLLPQNRALAVMAGDPDRPGPDALRSGVSNARKHQTFYDNHQTALSRDVDAARSAGFQTYLICCPALHASADRMEAPARLAPMLSPLFDEVRVICFLRPHLDAALQAASVAPMSGIPVTRQRFENLHPANGEMDYAAFLDRWAAGFGQDRVEVVAFKRHQPLAWLRDTLGLIRTDHRPAPPPARLDWQAHAICRQMDLPRHFDGASGATNPMAAFHPDAIRFEQGLSLSRREAQGWHRRFSHQITALVKKWPALSAADLEPDWDDYPQRGTLDLLDGGALGPAMAQIVTRLNAEAMFQHAEADATMADMARRLDDPVRSKRLLGRAQQALATAAPHLPASQDLPQLQSRIARLARQTKDTPKD